MSIKRHFVSKNPHGCLLEFDYKQLEIRVLALATGCVNLIHDLNNDVDMHTARAAEMYDVAESEVTKLERRRAKEFSFQLQYGASIKSIAEYWGVDQELVGKFFKAYFERYPEILVYHEEIRNAVLKNADHVGDYTDGDPVKRSIIPSIWDTTGVQGGFFITESIGTGGSRYAKPPGKRTYFPPTKLKNYPIQGGAADILLLVLSRLRRILHKWEDKVHILLQVHDSILFDWYANDINGMDEFIKEIKDLMESVPKILWEVFQIHSPVQFPVDVKIGPTWGAMSEYILVPF